MDSIIVLCGVALVAAVFAVMLKNNYKEMALVLSIAAGCLIVFAILTKLTPVISEIKGLIESSGIDTSFAVILFKVLGICFLTQFSSDACLDAGEKSLSSNIELAGKVSIVIVSLPLFKQILDVVASLIGG